MILRVLWPAVTKSPDPDSPSARPSLLLGAIITSQQQSKRVLTVAVISVCPAELLEPLARLQHQLSQTTVSLPTQPVVKASLAVVGQWRPSSSTQSYIINPEEQVVSQYGLWLAVHGHSMALPQCLGNSQRQQQPAMAPTCDLQLSTLPHGIQSVQVSSPAAHSHSQVPEKGGNRRSLLLLITYILLAAGPGHGLLHSYRPCPRPVP